MNAGPPEDSAKKARTFGFRGTLDGRPLLEAAGRSMASPRGPEGFARGLTIPFQTGKAV